MDAMDSFVAESSDIFSAAGFWQCDGKCLHVVEMPVSSPSHFSVNVTFFFVQKVPLKA